MTAAIIILGHLFGIVAFKRFRLATVIFLVLLPTYLIRLKIGPLPTTALEIFFIFYVCAWLFKHLRRDLPNLLLFLRKYRVFCWSFFTLFAASVVSIFISDMWWYSFGQWRAYFFEPFIFFTILVGRGSELRFEDLQAGLTWSALPVSLWAVIQGTTGYTLPADGRAVSFFTSPNSMGLYIAPIIVILSISVYKQFNKKISLKSALRFRDAWLLALSLVAIFFTRSFGTVLGLLAALLAGLYLLNKKRAAAALLIGFVFAAIVSAKMLPENFSKSQSVQNRLTLWTYSFEFLTRSPKNYFFGTGIRQFFRKIQKPHYEPKELERLIYPHNIFLNFWTETGLVGMLGFTGILASLAAFYRYIWRKKQVLSAITCFGIIVVILVHGLIDVPYFKNDLAMMFWALAAYIIKTRETV